MFQFSPIILQCYPSIVCKFQVNNMLAGYITVGQSQRTECVWKPGFVKFRSHVYPVVALVLAWMIDRPLQAVSLGIATY